MPPQGAPGDSGQLSIPRKRPAHTGRPATASGARASRLQSRRFHRLLTIQAHDGGAHELLHAHELKQPSSSPRSGARTSNPTLTLTFDQAMGPYL